MAETDNKSAIDLQPAPVPVPVRGVIDVIFASATEAIGSAFLLWILGGVAISIAGSFAGEMIPSLPPGLAASGTSEAHQAGLHHPWRHAVQSGAFGLIFAIFFVHSLWVGFRRGGVGAGRRIERILSNLRENWFGLMVGNAISAWVAILILGIAQNFSPMQMLWHAVSGMVLPVLREIGRVVLGASARDSLGGWLSWYEANQMKLDFWIIYLGGAFDDLGVPNFKTLARWAWRRMQKRKRVALPVPVERGDVV